MWLIILCSITALGIFLERLLYLHRASIPVGDLLRGLADVLRNENYAEALQECAGTPALPVWHMRSFCITRRRVRSFVKSLKRRGSSEVPRLEQNLPLLATIAYATPLIGLLGTLLGLLVAFQRWPPIAAMRPQRISPQEFTRACLRRSHPWR